MVTADISSHPFPSTLSHQLSLSGLFFHYLSFALSCLNPKFSFSYLFLCPLWGELFHKCLFILVSWLFWAIPCCRKICRNIQEQWSDLHCSSNLQAAACLRLHIQSPEGSCRQSLLQNPLLAIQRTAGIFLV